MLTAHALAQRALPAAGPPRRARSPASAPRRPNAGRWTPGTRSSGCGCCAPRCGRRARAGSGSRSGAAGWRPRCRGCGATAVPAPRGADELALDRTLSGLSPEGRAAYALHALDRLEDRELRTVLERAGAKDARAAVAEAVRVRAPRDSEAGKLLASAEFDPCTLQARPTDLARRRQHTRAALVAAAAAVVCGRCWGCRATAGARTAPPPVVRAQRRGGAGPGPGEGNARGARGVAARHPAGLRGLARAGRPDRRRGAVAPRAGGVGAPGDEVSVSATPGTRRVRPRGRRGCCTRARSTGSRWCCSSTGCGSCGTRSRRAPTAARWRWTSRGPTPPTRRPPRRCSSAARTATCAI
ncbi:hypothetical protein NKH77_15040 [Streptomyces sp. M19]